MKLSIPAGTTSKRIAIFIQDSSSTTGAGLTALVFNSAGLVCYSWIDTDGDVAGTAQALQTATRGTWTTRGFIQKDATNMPGLYEFGVPDALLAVGVKWAVIMFKGATNMAPLPIEIEVTATSNQDAVRGGMTALPNANAEAAGGLYTRGTGAGQIRQDANGRVDTNAKAWIDGTIPAVNVTGVPLVDLKYTLGTVSPATAGSVRADAVTGAVGSVTGLTASNLDATISSRTKPADTQAAVTTVTDLTVTANVEPTTPPASNAALSAKIAWLFLLARNKITQTSTTQIIKANDDTTTVGTSTVSDDATTFTRGKFV